MSPAIRIFTIKFFFTVLTGKCLDGSLTKGVLIVVLDSKVSDPVLTSHLVHGGRDKGGECVQSVDGVDGHRHPLPWSEVATFHLVTMGMDTFLSLRPNWSTVASTKVMAVLPVDGSEGHKHPLPRSEVTTFNSAMMKMDTFLILPPR